MHEVGQVLYLVLNKKQQVVPVQIVEQVVRRTMDGEETLHSVKIPTKESLYNLEELDADIYTTLEGVRKKMHDNANLAIEAMILKASEWEKEYFEAPPIDPRKYIPATTQSDVHEEYQQVPELEKRENSLGEEEQKMQITLENGTVANVLMSPTLIDQ
jgi:hypothetical protein